MNTRSALRVAWPVAALMLAGLCGPVWGQDRPTARLAPAPPAAAPAAPSIEQFLKIRAPASPTLAPDGTLYIRDWPDGVWQLYKVSPAAWDKDKPEGDYAPGKAKFTRLTDFKDGLGSYSLSPDARTIAILHAEGGNENFQISLLNTATGAITPVTTNPRVQHSVNEWLHDSSGFVYSANDESPNDFHLYRYDIASGKATKLLAREGSWACGDVTRDASRYLVTRFQSASDSLVYELDGATGELRELTIKDADSTASNGIVGYMPGEKQALLLSDKGDGLKRLYLRDLATGNVTRPVTDLGDSELDGGGTNRERTLLVLAVNEDGFGVPRVYSLPDFKPVPLPQAERGVVSVAGLRDRTLVWTQNNARSPGVAFATVLPAPGAPLAAPRTFQLTHAQTQGIDLAGFPLPELVKYKSFDGLEIPAFVFFPPGYDPRTPRPIPFICLYHGGPEGQHRPTFSAQNQYFLSRGYGIILPNVRGSTGYGRAFHMLDDYKNRWNSVRDGVAAAKFLVEKGYATPGRIATFGGSYGGFMSVACLVEDAEAAERNKTAPYFGAGVNIVGIVNMQTFLEKTSGYRRKLREAEYGPLTDPEFLQSVSPLNRIEYIRVPMLVAHGANDPRVPLNEAILLSVALMKRDQQVEQIYFPDEGHGFQKLENRLLFGRRTVEFLDRTIGR